MCSDRHTPERSARLFLDRWQEALTSPYPSRKARTLSTCSALAEVLALADSSVRSGGVMRPSVDPQEGGHGIAMLPDVMQETLAIIRDDRVMRECFSHRLAAVVPLVEKFKSKDGISVENVEQLRVLIEEISARYIERGFEYVAALIKKKPDAQEDIESLAGSLVSELRAAGWSDDGLAEVLARLRAEQADAEQVIIDLSKVSLAAATKFECFVAVALGSMDQLPATIAPDLQVTPRVSNELTVVGRPMKEGPHARATVFATDPTSAAHIAFRRVSAALGAATVFLPGSGVGAASNIVGVSVSASEVRTVEVEDRLPEERRSATAQQISQILTASWLASASSDADPLHDAIRLRHRAMMAADTESRLLLLWSGIERLTSGARGYPAALSAARDLVSKTVTLGKLRRDVGDLAAVLEHTVTDQTKRRVLLEKLGGYHAAGVEHLDRAKLLSLLLGARSELDEVIGLFASEDPVLVRRLYGCWKDFGEGDSTKRGKAIADYHRRSQQRVAWQVARLYRARNRIAHVGVGPERMRDLMWHAHFYLTQMVAICVHYSQAGEVPQELLVQRGGQYDAFLRLLEAGDPTMMTSKALMRPVQALRS